METILFVLTWVQLYSWKPQTFRNIWFSDHTSTILCKCLKLTTLVLLCQHHYLDAIMLHPRTSKVLGVFQRVASWRGCPRPRTIVWLVWTATNLALLAAGKLFGSQSVHITPRRPVLEYWLVLLIVLVTWYIVFRMYLLCIPDVQ